MDKLIEIINTILKNRGRGEINTIKGSSNLRGDLGFDSLDLAELTVIIESEYDVDIFEDGIVNTVEEIIDKIKKKQ